MAPHPSPPPPPQKVLKYPELQSGKAPFSQCRLCLFCLYGGAPSRPCWIASS